VETVSALKLIAGVIGNALIFAVPLFVFAGTLDWWRAWVVVGLMFAGSVWSVASLPRGVLEERLKGPVQKGQPNADKVLILFLLTEFVALLIIIPLDVFRLHLLSLPSPFVSAVGLVLFISGFWIAYLALRENSFAAPVVKHQEERNQTVVTSGVYGLVRHPLYAGDILFMLGLPLWLQSYAGALLSALLAATLVIRILIEERFLQHELPAYKAYSQRVRYRLIPFVW
jgi:protein-S-isoprenylcysteine O-methyltransferase Ste14